MESKPNFSHPPEPPKPFRPFNFDEHVYRSNAQVSAPAWARIQQLYAFGKGDVEIHEIISQEFQDFEANPISLISLRKMIAERRPELEAGREALAAACGEEVLQQGKELFAMLHKAENRSVTRLIKKMDNLVDQIELCDLTVLNDKGQPANLGVYAALLKMLGETQLLCAKIAGTDAVREIEIYRQKKQIDFDLKIADPKQGNLGNDGKPVEAGINFIDG
jgi:hypothetical protein